ncbi:hypothetical protein [Myxococcus eversor]|uniref:hypothetical protein n=1 Tax=Myxococcus eversor TaxID=2709661 RepID=UPI0013D351AD|nr:hypothetical protein [Myxococcus eversor]
MDFGWASKAATGSGGWGSGTTEYFPVFRMEGTTSWASRRLNFSARYTREPKVARYMPDSFTTAIRRVPPGVRTSAYPFSSAASERVMSLAMR